MRRRSSVALVTRLTRWTHSKTTSTTPQRLALLEKAGLLKSGDRGKYEYFRNRVMFPIADRRGRTIAFGGRVLGNSQKETVEGPAMNRRVLILACRTHAKAMARNI